MAEITDYLQNLEEQDFTEEKLVQITENLNVKKIIPVFESFLVKPSDFGQPGDRSRFTLAHALKSGLTLTEGLDCSAKDIRDFSIMLKKYEDYDVNNWSGMFISALINKSSDKDFEIISEHLTGGYFTYGISWLGHKNTKNVTIIGDVKDIGAYMESGQLIVKGNAKSGVGCAMNGGEIIIHGNSGQNTGDYMNGGKIVVHGNSGHATGNHMRGGEIYVNGEITSIDKENCKGKIYHKGALVWPR